MDRICMFLCRLNHIKGMSYIHKLLVIILKGKTVGILMECWWSAIMKSQSCKISFFSRDLARFHKPKVQPLFPFTFWAFWRKNGANRTNIKEGRAILRFFKMAAIFQPSCIRIFKIDRHWDIDLEVFHVRYVDEIRIYGKQKIWH